MVNPHDKLASYTLAKSLKFVDDHCVVGMPWKSGRTLLLDNNSMVLQRPRSTEGKLNSPRNVVKLTKKYCRPAKIKGYIS